MSAEKNTAEWIRLANLDLMSAHSLFDTTHPKPVEIICFHSQQSAEKMLKCFLVSKEIDPPKTHDLQVLLEMAFEKEDKFDELKTAAATLSEYGVIPRYPAELQLNETDAELALKYADKVTEIVNRFMMCGIKADTGTQLDE